MPRPKAKKRYHYEPRYVKAVSLDASTKEQLAELLGIENDEEKVKEMALQVEHKLNSHYLFVHHAEPIFVTDADFVQERKPTTPGQTKKALSDIIKHALALRVALEELDSDTLAKLYPAGLGEYDSYTIHPQHWTEQKWLSPYPHYQDMDDLQRIINRIEKVLTGYPENKRGRKKSLALGITMNFLGAIFSQYVSLPSDSKSIDVHRKRIDFISLALDAAGIKHPDPTTHTTRFINLIWPKPCRKPVQEIHDESAAVDLKNPKLRSKPSEDWYNKAEIISKVLEGVGLTFVPPELVTAVDVFISVQLPKDADQGGNGKPEKTNLKIHLDGPGSTDTEHPTRSAT